LKRVKLSFAGREVEFVDRERALRQVKKIAEKGTYPVYIVYGPEGCGKTALLKQVRALLEEEFGYHVVYVNPLARKLEDILGYTPSLKNVVAEVLKVFPEPYSRIVDAAISIAGEALRKFRRPRVAVLMDDIFQAVGLDKAEAYTKILLNLIEYPSGEYEKIVVLVSSSEGVTRERVGRHRWATFRLMWNMSREGFEELYRLLPEPKPPLEDAWRITGGNPAVLEQLFSYGWKLDDVVVDFIRGRKLRPFIAALSENERRILEEAVNDPDVIFERLREPEAQQLERKLVELNLMIEVWERDEFGWIDIPPPERDPELGVGRYIAWQTPLHREAIRRALKGFGLA